MAIYCHVVARKKKQKKESQPPKEKKLHYGLYSRFTPVIHREYHDQDYVHKLSDEEKTWLARFNETHLYGRTRKDGKDLYPPTPEDVAEDRSSKKMREIYAENYVRRQDIHGNMRVMGKLYSIEFAERFQDDHKKLLTEGGTINYQEDYMISLLDEGKKHED